MADTTCMTPVADGSSPVEINFCTTRLAQYNLYDRSARSVQPSRDSSLFYSSLRHLATAVSDPRGQWWLTLEPGTVVFINNWRVLHGRSAYSGARTITGAYISVGNLLSKARLLKLLL